MNEETVDLEDLEELLLLVNGLDLSSLEGRCKFDWCLLASRQFAGTNGNENINFMITFLWYTAKRAPF